MILGDAGDGLSACFGYPSTERSIERAVLAAIAVRDLRPAPTAGRRADRRRHRGRRHRGRTARAARTSSPGSPASRCGRRRGCGLCRGGRCSSARRRPTASATSWSSHASTRRWALTGARVGPPPAERRSRASAGLVGRESALDRAGCHRRHATTRVCPVVITGPAGIGKSAVAETFLAGLDAAGRWSRCSAIRAAASPAAPVPSRAARAVDDGAEPSARVVVAALRGRWGRRQPGAPRRRRRRRRSLDTPAARRAARPAGQRAGGADEPVAGPDRARRGGRRPDRLGPLDRPMRQAPGRRRRAAATPGRGQRDRRPGRRLAAARRRADPGRARPRPARGSVPARCTTR